MFVSVGHLTHLTLREVDLSRHLLSFTNTSFPMDTAQNMTAALSLGPKSADTVTMAAAPLVWINGFPGTGKYTIAKQLVSLLGNEKAILIDNHQLIDPVEQEIALNRPEYQNVRLHPNYQNRRREKRVAAFEQYVVDASMHSTTVIFTGKHSLHCSVATVF